MESGDAIPTGEVRVDPIRIKVEGNKITAHEGGGEVGQIQLSFTDSGRAVIVDIGVKRELQEKGIGGRLTDEAEKLAREQGATEIGAIAQPDYLRLLEKRGFKSAGFFATKKL